MNNCIRVMTLNLHTYQEIDAAKFHSLEDFFDKYMDIELKIAAAIKEKGLDIICFQEAAQHKDMPLVMKIGEVNIKKHNIILDIQRLLKEKYNLEYNFIWDWSHYGWDVWEEGVGILTRYSIKKWQSRYVSEITNVNNMYARKVIRGELALPSHSLDVFSAHLNWWETGFKKEIDNIFNWMSEDSSSSNFIIAGDLNNEAGGTGYNYFMSKTLNNIKLVDVYYETNKHDFYGATIRGDAFNTPQRIDYILINSEGDMIAKKSELIFKDDYYDCSNAYGRVSDHMGVIAELMIKGN